MFRTVPLSTVRSFSLYTQRAGSGWNCSSVLILLASCQQTCMTYTIAVCTVKNSWWWTEELSETYRVLFKNKFERLVHLVGFIVRIYHEARSPERQTLCTLFIDNCSNRLVSDSCFLIKKFMICEVTKTLHCSFYDLWLFWDPKVTKWHCLESAKWNRRSSESLW